MADIRLKSERLELTDGNVFEISCSMAALADIEAEFGSVEAALNGKQTYSTVMALLTIFVNCAAEASGRELKYSPKTLARVLPAYTSKHYIDMVMRLVLDSLGTEPIVADNIDESKN